MKPPLSYLLLLAARPMSRNTKIRNATELHIAARLCVIAAKHADTQSQICRV